MPDSPILLAKNRDWGGLRIALHRTSSLPRTLRDELLVRTVVSGDTKLLAAILKRGANINGSWNTYTPLTTACELLDRKLIRWLLKNGASVKRKGYDQATPLIATAKVGLEWEEPTLRAEGVRIARLVIQSGCPVNARDVISRTALDYAFEADWPQLASVLVASGAKIGRCEDAGQMAAFYLVNNSSDARLWKLFGKAGGTGQILVADDVTLSEFAKRAAKSELAKLLDT